MDVANAENAGAQSAKEKYPKEIRPMPLASCVLAFLSGFAKRHFPVPLAKRGFLAALLRAGPEKNASARRSIRGWAISIVS
jgi:hypothetical protein